MKTKICFKCNTDKPLSDYYKHKAMGDGHLNKCKDCTRKDTKKRTDILANDPQWVEKEKARQRDKQKRLGYDIKYKPTPEKKKEIIARYASKFPEKATARGRMGKMKAKVKGNHLHHWSYNEEHYKDVVELNEADHNLVHRCTEYDQERMMYRVAVNQPTAWTGILLDSKELAITFYKTIGVNLK